MNYLRNYVESRPVKFYNKPHEHVPVFVHIPKCAGTYTLSVLRELLRLHSYLTFRSTPMENLIIFEIKHRGVTCISILALDAKKSSKVYIGKYEHTTDFENFINFYNTGDISVFAVAVTSGMQAHKKQEELYKILEILEKKCVFFTNLRTPYSRAFSMYKVHKANNRKLASLNLKYSGHSPAEFENFLTSPDSEPGWVKDYLSYTFQKTQEELITFLQNSVYSTHFLNALDQINFIFRKLYGDSLANFLNFIPTVQLNENKGVPIKLYNPEELSDEGLDKYKKLHSVDIELVTQIMPWLKYDETHTCTPEEKTHA
jgi:hypothetical protein